MGWVFSVLFCFCFFKLCWSKSFNFQSFLHWNRSARYMAQSLVLHWYWLGVFPVDVSLPSGYHIELAFCSGITSSNSSCAFQRTDAGFLDSISNFNHPFDCVSQPRHLHTLSLFVVEIILINIKGCICGLLCAGYSHWTLQGFLVWQILRELFFSLIFSLSPGQLLNLGRTKLNRFITDFVLWFS